jgi:hypothetical protein
VNSGATLAGALFYRGEVKDNIANHLPINEWSFETALAYFCTNVNENLSFSSYFRQTRARLYLCAKAKFENKASKVQEMYMLACAEENNNARIKSRGFKPTHYRERFIHDLQKAPDDFEVFPRNRNDGILKEMQRMMDGWRSLGDDYDPNNTRHQQLSVIGSDLVEFFCKSVPNGGPKPSNIPGVSSTDVIQLDVTKYQPYTTDYRIFTGLLRGMPGFRTYETIDLFPMDNLTDALDGLKVAKDIGLTLGQGSGSAPLDLMTMPEMDLSRFSDVVTLNFD